MDISSGNIFWWQDHPKYDIYRFIFISKGCLMDIFLSHISTWRWSCSQEYCPSQIFLFLWQKYSKMSNKIMNDMLMIFCRKNCYMQMIGVYSTIKQKLFLIWISDLFKPRNMFPQEKVPGLLFLSLWEWYNKMSYKMLNYILMGYLIGK